MPTITVPHQIIKNDDLVIMPRKEYEQLLRTAKNRLSKPLDEDLLLAIREVDSGQAVGPFNSVKALEASLEK